MVERAQSGSERGRLDSPAPDINDHRPAAQGPLLQQPRASRDGRRGVSCELPLVPALQALPPQAAPDAGTRARACVGPPLFHTVRWSTAARTAVCSAVGQSTIADT
ncbi:unnamed protein product [Prorocentrum cordatum]|uniref:Uncharacterized protein n=1 Tax=Prorocentrum cordatum TaxID=2364126 RepID=A0ABN9Q0J3_9DINO|nr:unnamed protein product [Polarella glacialis]